MRAHPIASLLLLGALTAHAVDLPKVVTFRVVPGPALPVADGAPWRTWPVADPAQMITSGAPGSVAVGAQRAGVALIEASLPSAGPLLDDRVVVIEQDVPDFDAPGGLAGIVAIARMAHASAFRALPPVTTVALQAPSAAAIDASSVRLQLEALVADALPLGEADGFSGFAVQRCDANLASCVEVGRVAAASLPGAFVDTPPPGAWRYSLRALFAGGVLGLGVSPASSTVEVIAVPCAEPSALDVTPSARPLLVTHVGDVIRLSWQPSTALFDVARVALPAPMLAPELVACEVATPSLERNEPWSLAGYVVAGHCGSVRSSFGRDSGARERPSAPACP